MITITGPRRKKRIIELPQRRKFIWVYPTDQGELSIPDMSIHTGIPEQTLLTRINRYGCQDERVFSMEYLPQASENTWEKKKARDIRHLCKRGEVLCKSYHACQSSRLGMDGSPEWIEPEDTDRCFEPEDGRASTTYSSSLGIFHRLSI